MKRKVRGLINKVYLCILNSTVEHPVHMSRVMTGFSRTYVYIQKDEFCKCPIIDTTIFLLKST